VQPSYFAQAEAKAERRNVSGSYKFRCTVVDIRQIWRDYDPEVESRTESTAGADDTQALKTEYLDIIVSAIRVMPTFSFSVQILNTEGLILCTDHILP
jgi:hypothetical protein